MSSSFYNVSQGSKTSTLRYRQCEQVMLILITNEPGTPTKIPGAATPRTTPGTPRASTDT